MAPLDPLYLGPCLQALAALVSNDFADEIEYLKLLTMYDGDSLFMLLRKGQQSKGIFQQSNELDPINFSEEGTASLSARFLAHPLCGSLRGPCYLRKM